MLLPTSYASRWPARLGLLTMLALLALSWHLYLERVAYSDLAFHVFVNIQNKDFFVQNRRWAQAPTQLLPVLAIRAGWPLPLLLRLFSVSFLLYYLLIYALSAYALRNVRAALLMPLALALLAARTFYWPQAELAQAIAALVLVHAGISRRAPLGLGWPTLGWALLLAVGIFGHPLAIFVFLFLWAYEWLLHARWRDWGFYGILAAGLLTYYVRATTVPAGTLEDVGTAFENNLRTFYPHYLGLPSFHDFWVLWRGNFIALPAVLLAFTGYCLYQRTWPAVLRLLLTWGTVGIYSLIVNVWRPENTEQTYMENLYLPLGIFVAAPLVFDLLPALERQFGYRGPVLAATVLGLVLAGRTLVVYAAHTPFTAYEQWLQQTLRYTSVFPERRFLVDSRNADPNWLRSGYPWWASPYETLLLSALPSPDSARTVFISDDLPRLMAAGRTGGMFLGAYNEMPSWDLAGRYFRIGARNQPYRLLNTDPPTDTLALRSYIAARSGTHLRLVELPRTLRAGTHRTARVQLTVPAASQPLHSGMHGPHPTLLRTRFHDPSGWPTPDEPVEVPLEMDVWHPWLQEVPLKCPARPGKYLLEISLFSKNYHDWPVHLRVPVEVN